MEVLKLYDFVDEVDEEEESVEEKYKGFVVSDLASADWALRKIKQNNARADERIKYAEAEIEKLKAFIANEKSARDNSNAYLESLLWNYLIEKKVDDDKFKIKTATGTVSARNTAKWDYGDENKLLEFLKKNDMNDFVRTKEEINKAKLKKAVKVLDNGKVVNSDGEVVEGVTVADSISLSIKFY